MFDSRGTEHFFERIFRLDMVFKHILFIKESRLHILYLCMMFFFLIEYSGFFLWL